jgi:hypothetical protein
MINLQVKEEGVGTQVEDEEDVKTQDDDKI